MKKVVSFECIKTFKKYLEKGWEDISNLALLQREYDFLAGKAMLWVTSSSTTRVLLFDHLRGEVCSEVEFW